MPQNAFFGGWKHFKTNSWAEFRVATLNLAGFEWEIVNFAGGTAWWNGDQIMLTNTMPDQNLDRMEGNHKPIQSMDNHKKQETTPCSAKSTSVFHCSSPGPVRAYMFATLLYSFSVVLCQTLKLKKVSPAHITPVFSILHLHMPTPFAWYTNNMIS